jgi:hypothetical protein
MLVAYKRRIRRSLEGCKFRLSFRLTLFEEDYCLDLFGFFIPLAFLDRWHRDPHEILESWGFTFFERTIHLNWGRHCKVIHLPWQRTLVKHEVRRIDGMWVTYVPSYSKDPPDNREYQEFNYVYTLRSGETQRRKAKVYVEQWTTSQRWLTWCPLFWNKSQAISVEFSDEVGEETGSWKGGCVGCGYNMLPGETAEQTLRRMERERTF